MPATVDMNPPIMPKMTIGSLASCLSANFSVGNRETPNASSTIAPTKINSHGPLRKYTTATAGTEPSTKAPARIRNLAQSVRLRTDHALFTALMMDRPFTMVTPASGPNKEVRTGPVTRPTPNPVMRWRRAPMRTDARSTIAMVNTINQNRRSTPTPPSREVSLYPSMDQTQTQRSALVVNLSQWQRLWVLCDPFGGQPWKGVDLLLGGFSFAH